MNQSYSRSTTRKHPAGRTTTIALAAAACVLLLALSTAAAQHAGAILQQRGWMPALFGTSMGAAGAQAPAQPFARVTAPAWSMTDQTMAQLQEHVRTNPEDAAAYAQLGSVYLQKARETGDPSFYASAESALTRSLAIEPENVLGTVVMGGLHMARHNFSQALEWGMRAQQMAPRGHIVYGIIGDALIELGQYEAAIEALQVMVDLRPDLTSLSRVSYARELHGDLDGAIVAMKQAVDAGAPRSEATNWSRVQLGHLYFLSGDLQNAELSYRLALHLLPDYVHGLGGMARVEAARGNWQEAIRLYERALEVAPLPEYAVALVDVYRATGNNAAAARQLELVRVIGTLQRAGGMDVDLDMALIEADHAHDPIAVAKVLEAARQAYEKRPENIHAADVLAWALHRAGRSAEALQHARDALRLGTSDPVMLYHAGAIAVAAGEAEEGRRYLEAALARNDQFHVRFAPEAKQLLAQVK